MVFYHNRRSPTRVCLTDIAKPRGHIPGHYSVELLGFNYDPSAMKDKRMVSPHTLKKNVIFEKLGGEVNGFWVQSISKILVLQQGKEAHGLDLSHRICSSHAAVRCDWHIR